MYIIIYCVHCKTQLLIFGFPFLHNTQAVYKGDNITNMSTITTLLLMLIFTLISTI